MSGVLRGVAPAACKEAALDVQVYASPQQRDRRAKTLACPAIALFWATADAAPAKVSGISHLIYKWKVLSFSSKNISFMNWKLLSALIYLWVDTRKFPSQSSENAQLGVRCALSVVRC